ncbi:unnamed protein product, partial [Rotaria sp. Silwood1]
MRAQRGRGHLSPES